MVEGRLKPQAKFEQKKRKQHAKTVYEKKRCLLCVNLGLTPLNQSYVGISNLIHLVNVSGKRQKTDIRLHFSLEGVFPQTFYGAS